MASSLYTALSGLRSHQQWIDVVGNNLANSNTPGFKSSRTTFSDALTLTLRPGTGPTGSAGGRNPLQVGLGVGVSDVTRDFDQGALTNTGRIFDLSLDGRGYFAMNDGARRVYTRVGTFGLDVQNDLVDQRTGFRVLDPTGNPVNLDVTALYPPRASTTLGLTGNLPAVVTGPLSEILTGTTGLKEGQPASIIGTTAGPNYAVPAGATFSMEIVVSSGAPQFVTVTDSDTDGILTAAEIAAEINQLDDVEASITAAGLVEIDTSRTGSSVTLKINAGAAGVDLADLVGFSTAQTTGSETDVSATTSLNDLPSNLTNYINGDTLQITGLDTDGTQISDNFVYGTDGTTVDELVSFIDGLYSDAQVSLNASGQIVVSAQTAGESNLLLSIEDDPNNAGGTNWSDYAVSVTTDGTGPDTVTTSTEVYDQAGVAHTMTLSFTREVDGSWTLTPNVPTDSGTVTSDPIEGLRFGADGSPVGLGAVLAQVDVRFSNQPASQTIELNIGSDGGFGGLTQFGGQTSVYVQSQNGYGDGELADIIVRSDGGIDGFYTNGQTRALGAVGIANFSNESGLAELGGNVWVESSNSGSGLLGAGGAQGNGSVVGGTLENSNVDTAEQFVRLIEAQRGFQANARVITTQNEVMGEVVNLI